MANAKPVSSRIKSGRQLAAARRKLGLTQRQLAADIGCTYETISNYERGETEITPFIGTYLRYYFTYGPLDRRIPKASR